MYVCLVPILVHLKQYSKPKRTYQMDTVPKRNIGTSLMILQQQYNHNKKLSAIYQRTISFPSSSSARNDDLRHRQRNLKRETINSYEREEHLKNIKKLLLSITKEKTLQDRLKDQTDFFAYPALFFREVSLNAVPKKVKKQKKQKRQLTDHSEEQNNVSKLSVEKIRQSLPVLTNFDQYDLEEWADAVNTLVINFNVMEKDELLSLAVKVLSLLPKSCPREFRQAAQKWMDGICSDKIEVW